MQSSAYVSQVFCPCILLDLELQRVALNLLYFGLHLLLLAVEELHLFLQQAKTLYLWK